MKTALEAAIAQSTKERQQNTLRCTCNEKGTGDEEGLHFEHCAIQRRIQQLLPLAQARIKKEQNWEEDL